MFIKGLFRRAKRWEKPMCLSKDEQTKYITYMCYYSAIRRKEILTHAMIQVNMKGIMINEISHSQLVIKELIFYCSVFMRSLELNSKEESRMVTIRGCENR
jgi:hypothetical protein